MKKAFQIIAVLGFIFIITLGFMGLSFMGEAHNLCPISSIFGIECPPSDNIFALVAHHISGFQYLTQFTLNSDLSLLLVLFSVLLLLVIPFLYPKSNPSYSLSFRAYKVENRDINPNKKFIRWFSILNKRDPHMPIWAHDFSFST